MSVIQSAEKAWGNLSVRLLTLVVGVGLVVGLLSLYPQILPVIEWTIPLGLIFWGVSRFYLYGVGDTLTSTAGCLLILGGFTLALYQLIPMGELTGTVAHLIPTTGIFVELFAVHYRDEA
ncbi:hypothetical protein BDK88_4249 [Natrinema hispanicum]|uniref:Uncharacterized protein n=1 Tax=Natrinema hispanicum TaxID=392421 RepID=A0A482Y717_9EURY|nr:hypothetical protein [Natrinema hispanicum]RZV05226.1 hypothetical protein BDK88_4249 [Natrinema hispanicum]